MARPQTRQEFKEYCLRALGKPVIRINVSDDQIDDRIDEAFQVYSERHYDAYIEKWVMYRTTAEDVARGYLKTPSNILAVQQLLQSSGPSQDPAPTSTVTNDPDAAPAPDPNYTEGDDYEVGASGYPGNPPYVYGEPGFTVSSWGQASEDSVTGSEWGSDYNLSPEFGMMWDIYSPWAGADLLDYYIKMLTLNETRDLIGTTVRFEHSRHTGELVVYDGRAMGVGRRYYCLVSQIIEPEDHPEIWNDRWFKQYCIEMIRKQWGSNMIKHGDIQLLGGVTVNGQTMIDMAERAMETLRTQLIEEFTEPVGFFVG